MCAPGSYAFDVTAKESRTFSGGSTIEGNDPTITCYDQVCTAGPCNQTDPETGTNLQTTVPGGATLGINFQGAPNDACGTEDTGLARVQLDPLNYLVRLQRRVLRSGSQWRHGRLQELGWWSHVRRALQLQRIQLCSVYRKRERWSRGA